MHGTIRFRTDSDDLLVRTHQSITAAIAEREAAVLPGLNASTMAGQLIVQGDEDAVGGDMNAAPALAGQSAGLIHAVKPVQQIIDETVADFHAISARMGAMAAARQFA